jgi:hypothetical protein
MAEKKGMKLAEMEAVARNPRQCNIPARGWNKQSRDAARPPDHSTSVVLDQLGFLSFRRKCLGKIGARPLLRNLGLESRRERTGLAEYRSESGEVAPRPLLRGQG